MHTRRPLTTLFGAVSLLGLGGAGVAWAQPQIEPGGSVSAETSTAPEDPTAGSIPPVSFSVSSLDDGAWEAFDHCLETQGVVWPDDAIWVDIEDADLTEEEIEALLDDLSTADGFDWDTFDRQLEAAETACFDQLPTDIQNEELAWMAEEEAWDAYDTCLADQGVVWPEEELWNDPAHAAMTIAEAQAHLDAIDWDDFDRRLDAAEESCDDLLPEDTWCADLLFEDDDIGQDGDGRTDASGSATTLGTLAP